MADPLSKPLRQLVDAGIATMEQLELVIAVQRGEPAGHTAARLTSLLRTSDARTEAGLGSLEALGVLARDDQDPPHWCVSRTDLLPAIHATSDALVNNRQRVVNHFYAHRLDSLRAFSDAFRLRKDP